MRIATLCLTILAVVLTWGSAPARAQDDLSNAPVREVPEYPFDQEHLALAVRLVPAEARLVGEALLQLRTLEPGVDELVLFGAGLEVDSVLAGLPETPLSSARFTQRGDSLLIDLTDLAGDSLSGTLPADQPVDVRVHYGAQPRRGLYFVTSASGETYVASDGKPDGNRHWFPAWDHPNDRLTSELFVTVPAELRVLANGAPVGERPNDDGTVTFHYLQREPHPTHGVALVAGPFEVDERTVRLPGRPALRLATWHPPGWSTDGGGALAAATGALRCVSERLDEPYPWERYAQAVLPAAPFSHRAFTGFAVFADDVLADPGLAEWLVREAAAAQWFGHLVHAGFWTDAWLDAAAATYLAAGCTAGGDGDVEAAVRARLDDVAGAEDVSAPPLAWDRWRHPVQVLAPRRAVQGAAVLHTLAQSVGRDVFWEGVADFVDDHAYRAVSTADFRNAVEHASGAVLADFFDAWVYGAGHPVVEAAYRYASEAGAVSLTLRQTQDGPRVPAAYDLRLTGEAAAWGDPEPFEVRVDAREETVSVPLDAAPRFVSLAPAGAPSVVVRVTQPASAWVAQLRYATEAGSRRRAAEALAASGDDPALLIALRTAFDREPSPDVRAAIIRTVGRLPASGAAERILLAAYEDANPHVRRAALLEIGGYEASTQAAALARRAAQTDASPRVQGAAVVALARLGTPDALDVVRSALVTPSPGEVIRTAAFDALTHLSLDARRAAELVAGYAGNEHPYGLRAAAMRFLAGVVDDAPRAQDVLVEALASPQPRVRRAAVEALVASSSRFARTVLEERLDVEPEPAIRLAVEAALAGG